MRFIKNSGLGLFLLALVVFNALTFLGEFEVTRKALEDIKIKISILKNRNLSYYNNFYHQRCQLTSMIEDGVYSHSSTVTGRSTIKKGTNYLTMKKQDRKNIKSVFPGGKIIEIDILGFDLICQK